MTENVRSENPPGRVLEDSIRHPVRMMIILYVIAVILKILDSFVFRLGDLLGELIFTKALGFVMLIVYLSMCGRSLRDIGFHRRRLGQSLLISAVCVGGLFAVAFIGQLIAFRAGGEDARFVLSAVDPKTGMTGGLWFGLWLIFGNLVNSAMEEGLFRGAMLRHFRIKLSVRGAILLQALFFALWHLDGPVKQLTTGQATVGEAGMGALSIVLATGIGGVMYGYLYHKTDNQWAPYLAHLINNTVLNILFYQVGDGMRPGYEFPLFLALWLPGYLALIPIIGWWAKRLNLPEVEPWGQFSPSESE